MDQIGIPEVVICGWAGGDCHFTFTWTNSEVKLGLNYKFPRGLGLW